MAGQTLVSTVVMAVVVVGVATWVTMSPRWDRGRTQKRPARGEAESDTDPDSKRHGLSRVTESQSVWTVGFSVLVVGTVVAVVGLSTGPVGGLSSGVVAFVAGLGALVVAYLLAGIYLVAKTRGHPPSVAAAESASVGGAIFLLAVVAQLLG